MRRYTQLGLMGGSLLFLLFIAGCNEDISIENTQEKETCSWQGSQMPCFMADMAREMLAKSQNPYPPTSLAYNMDNNRWDTDYYTVGGEANALAGKWLVIREDAGAAPYSFSHVRYTCDIVAGQSEEQYQSDCPLWQNDQPIPMALNYDAATNILSADTLQQVRYDADPESIPVGGNLPPLEEQIKAQSYTQTTGFKLSLLDYADGHLRGSAHFIKVREYDDGRVSKDYTDKEQTFDMVRIADAGQTLGALTEYALSLSVDPTWPHLIHTKAYDGDSVEFDYNYVLDEPIVLENSKLNQPLRQYFIDNFYEAGSLDSSRISRLELYSSGKRVFYQDGIAVYQQATFLENGFTYEVRDEKSQRIYDGTNYTQLISASGSTILGDDIPPRRNQMQHVKAQGNQGQYYEWFKNDQSGVQTQFYYTPANPPENSPEWEQMSWDDISLMTIDLNLIQE